MILSRQYLYRKSKRGHLTFFLMRAKERAKAKQLPLDIDLDYLESIATDACPVFGTPFSWGFNGTGKVLIDGPSLDRIIPEYGYIRGNVVFISNRANRIKQDVTEKELYIVADWLHDKRKEVIRVLQITDAPIPETNGRSGKKNTQHGPIYGTRAWKDCNGSHHHQGELFGEDVGDSPEASSGVSLGPGMPEMGSPERAEGGKDNGNAKGTPDGAA